MNIQMKTKPINSVTKESLMKATTRALARLTKDPRLTSCTSSAGFAFGADEPKGHREGLQVFVNVCWYSDGLLKRKPLTGGLYCKE